MLFLRVTFFRLIESSRILLLHDCVLISNLLLLVASTFLKEILITPPEQAKLSSAALFVSLRLVKLLHATCDA
jgi:hypothetical protein